MSRSESQQRDFWRLLAAGAAGAAFLFVVHRQRARGDPADPFANFGTTCAVKTANAQRGKCRDALASDAPTAASALPPPSKPQRAESPISFRAAFGGGNPRLGRRRSSAHYAAAEPARDCAGVSSPSSRERGRHSHGWPIEDDGAPLVAPAAAGLGSLVAFQQARGFTPDAYLGGSDTGSGLGAPDGANGSGSAMHVHRSRGHAATPPLDSPTALMHRSGSVVAGTHAGAHEADLFDGSVTGTPLSAPAASAAAPAGPAGGGFGSRGTDVAGAWLPTGAGFRRGRRSTVSGPSTNLDETRSYQPDRHPKPADVELALTRSLARCHLFSQLDEESLRVVALAMQEVQFDFGDYITLQGDTMAAEDHRLFVLYEGEVSVIEDKTVRRVLRPGATFGERHVMFVQETFRLSHRVDTPRCVCYALGGDEYRHIVTRAAVDKRALYRGFLDRVPWLGGLTHAEKMQLADCLQPVTYADGEYLIEFGTTGYWLFIILEGTVAVHGRKNWEVVYVCSFTVGDCVGELEFLNNHRTVADVRAEGGRVKAARLHRDHFELCMGPIVDVLRRSASADAKFAYYRSVLLADERRRDGGAAAAAAEGAAATAAAPRPPAWTPDTPPTWARGPQGDEDA